LESADRLRDKSRLSNPQLAHDDHGASRTPGHQALVGSAQRLAFVSPPEPLLGGVRHQRLGDPFFARAPPSEASGPEGSMPFDSDRTSRLFVERKASTDQSEDLARHEDFIQCRLFGKAVRNL